MAWNSLAPLGDANVCRHKNSDADDIQRMSMPIDSKLIGQSRKRIVL
jgi:hypothetical protein